MVMVVLVLGNGKQFYLVVLSAEGHLSLVRKGPENMMSPISMSYIQILLTFKDKYNILIIV